MKKLTVLAAGLLLLVPSLAFSDSFSLRLGYFMPRALSNNYFAAHDNSLWTIELSQMSFRTSDYRGLTFGASYEYFVNKTVSLALTVDSFRRDKTGYYDDWVMFSLDEGDFAFPYADYDGDDIFHSFRVSSTPLQLSVKFAPLGRKARLIPFVGGGAGIYFWNVAMYGQYVDFGDPWVYTDPDLGDVDIYPVADLNARENGIAFGWHAFAGIQVPVGYRTTIEAEVRYHSAQARFNDWFLDFDKFDLGGIALTAGFSYWF
jgi:hypothetical protein